MPISYAQNFEDIMLWRALKNAGNGFYIDVGAAWPDHHSVTKLFYDQGWRGINVEPNAEFWTSLCGQRPEDVNLNMALSSQVGSEDVYVIAGTGLSTLKPDIAALHEASGFTHTVARAEVSTLKDLWLRHVGEREVHFLKIDVEGHERDVIAGNDWQRNRPWIVVVEATLPMSQVESFADWESILLDAAYHLAYADGLNRFYVAGEHRELLPAFSTPPNVFDGFVPAAQDSAENRSRAAEADSRFALSRVSQLEAELDTAREMRNTVAAKLERTAARLAISRQRAQAATAQLRKLRASLSWRLTRPFRRLRRILRRLGNLRR